MKWNPDSDWVWQPSNKVLPAPPLPFASLRVWSKMLPNWGEGKQENGLDYPACLSQLIDLDSYLETMQIILLFINITSFCSALLR